jgi:protein TonB
MQQPQHDLRPLGGAQATPRRFVSIVAVAIFHVIVIYALASGLAAQLIQKLPEDITTEVIKEKPPDQNKLPPPPPPEMVKPPPPFVPPPDINVQAETNTNAITQVTTTKVVVETPKPQISAPASIGRPHSCPTAKWYPPQAIRLNHEGTTTLAFTVGADGGVSNITVANSSGHDELDQAAVSCAAGWTYKAAVQNGQPVAVPWKTSVKWNLGGG